MRRLLALAALSGQLVPAPKVQGQAAQRDNCWPELVAIREAELRRDAAYFREISPVLECVSQASVNWAARHHKSGVVRTAVIQQRDLDQPLLAEIALQDGDRDVRVEAIKKLEDQRVLAQIALSKAHSDVRVEAVLRLKDQGAIERIVLDGRDEYIVRWNALRVIESDRVLAKVFSEKSSLMEGVDLVLVDRKVAKVRDQEALRQMVWESAYLGVRTAAVWNLTDQGMLADVVLKHPEVNIQVHAVKRVTDQTVLARVALEHASTSVRSHAVKALDDQAVLSKAALKDEDYGIRLSAAQRVTDQAVLRTLIKDTDAEMRKRAATNLDDEQELRRLVENDVRDVAMVAVGRVKNQELLLKWAQSHPEPRVRWQAIQGLAPDIDRDLLTLAALDRLESIEGARQILKSSSAEVRRAALDSTSRWTRGAALSVSGDLGDPPPRDKLLRMVAEDPVGQVRVSALVLLKDPTEIERSARENTDPHVRKWAANSLPHDHPTQVLLALTDPAPEVRSAAAEWIRSPMLVKDVIVRSEDRTVRRILARRLEDRELLGILAKTDSDLQVREAATERLKALSPNK